MRRRIGFLLAMLLVMIGAARAEALCLVTENGALLVDENGEALITGVDDVFAVRPNALYAAGSRGAYRLYDAGGALLTDTEFAMIDDQGDCLIFRQGNLYGAMDLTGNVVLPAEWTQLVSDGAGGWLALNTDPLDDSPDAIFHIDIFGEAVDTGSSTMIGLSRVIDDRMPFMAADGRYGAVDGRGAIAIDPDWHYIAPFEGGLAKAGDEFGLGLIDVNGAAIVPTVYDWLERGERCVVAMDSTGVDVYDSDARLLFSVQGENLETALAGDYVAVRNGAHTRLYNLNGETIFEGASKADFVPGLDGQLIAGDGAWGEACQWIMNPDGSAASERYQRILPLAAGRYAFMTMAGSEYYSADLDGVQTSWNYESVRYGLMDGAGNERLPDEYLEIRALSDARLLLITGEGTRLADMDGSVLNSWPTLKTEEATGEAGGEGIG